MTNPTDIEAARKSRAIDTLRPYVVVLRHPYESDPFSGAENCWCGREQRSALHERKARE